MLISNSGFYRRIQAISAFQSAGEFYNTEFCNVESAMQNSAIEGDSWQVRQFLSGIGQRFSGRECRDLNFR